MILTAAEKRIFERLKTPGMIQDYLDALKINFEEKGDTCSSPRVVIRRGSAHCIEAALLAAAIMIRNKQKPLLLDLKANGRDYDHVVCVFKQKGFFGAISKSNHATLRFREPVYKNVRELAMSYFHEYINDKGEKTLKSYASFSLARYELDWVTSENDLWTIANELDEAKHAPMAPKNARLRKADAIEIKAGKLLEHRPPRNYLLKYK